MEKSVPINAPTIILVRPQLPENIGMAARAMVNFGLQDLRLVNPRDEFPSIEAISASSGASEIIFPKVKIFDKLAHALQDFHYLLATSARPRQQAIAVFPPEIALAKLLELTTSPFDSVGKFPHAMANRNFQPNIGILFGPERTGLTNDEIAHCHAVLEFPTNPEFPSINLAGSVLLFCYLWRQTILKSIAPETIRLPFAEPASFASRDHFIERLLSALTDKGFFKSPAMRPSLSRNIRQMFIRANFSEQEIRTWQGILTILLDNNPKTY